MAILVPWREDILGGDFGEDIWVAGLAGGEDMFGCSFSSEGEDIFVIEWLTPDAKLLGAHAPIK